MLKNVIYSYPKEHWKKVAGNLIGSLITLQFFEIFISDLPIKVYKNVTCEEKVKSCLKNVELCFINLAYHLQNRCQDVYFC